MAINKTGDLQYVHTLHYTGIFDIQNAIPPFSDW